MSDPVEPAEGAEVSTGTADSETPVDTSPEWMSGLSEGFDKETYGASVNQFNPFTIRP